MPDGGAYRRLKTNRGQDLTKHVESVYTKRKESKK